MWHTVAWIWPINFWVNGDPRYPWRATWRCNISPTPWRRKTGRGLGSWQLACYTVTERSIITFRIIDLSFMFPCVAILFVLWPLSSFTSFEIDEIGSPPLSYCIVNNLRRALKAHFNHKFALHSTDVNYCNRAMFLEHRVLHCFNAWRTLFPSGV